MRAFSEKIKGLTKWEFPKHQTEFSAGADLQYFDVGNDPIVLKPLERKLVPTGLYLEIPTGYEGQIRPRSGLAYKHGITVLNSPATIDSDYRGEIKVLLINLSNEEFTINKGDRIAQLVIAPYLPQSYERVFELNNTVRSAGGFGHTGK